MSAEPAIATQKETYNLGDIVKCLWGSEQTNVDFFKITRRTGDMVTLTPLTNVNAMDAKGFMTGTCVPGEIDPKGKILRRRIVRDHSNVEIGCRYKSYGWISAWAGRPVGFSTYG